MSCLHSPLPYVRASQAERAVSTVGKSSKDFPLPIFPALMASTKRDASCARQEPFRVWVCERHLTSLMRLHGYFRKPASAFWLSSYCHDSEWTAEEQRLPPASGAQWCQLQPQFEDPQTRIEEYSAGTQEVCGLNLLWSLLENLHKDVFSYSETMALCGNFETIAKLKHHIVKWWMWYV